MIPKTILVIAAHPDDEILGCGASIAKWAAQGAAVYIAILAEGLTSRDIVRDVEGKTAQLHALGDIAKQAGALVGARAVELFQLPDNRMDSMDLLDVVKIVEGLITKYQPDTVVSHHRGDVNIDHQITHQAVLTATRPVPNQCVKRILSFEIASSTEWATPPNFPATWYEDVSTHMPTKLDALALYAYEMRPFPHARSLKAVEALATWRGASIGTDFAEAFVLERQIT